MVARLVSDREVFAAAVRQSDPSWLAASGVAGVVAIVGIGVNWVGILRARRVEVRSGPGMRWFAVGQLGKYVPGGIWPVVGQGELASRGGVARSDAYPATVLSMASTLAGAAIVAAVAGMASPDDDLPLSVGLALAVGGGFAVLSVSWLRRRAEAAVRSMSRGRLVLPDAGNMARWTLFHVPVWLSFSAMNLFVVVALNGPHDAGFVSQLVFVTCVSWMAGFVIIGLPGGIGVREAVFVSLMTGPLGGGLAVTVAVVARLVSILVDLLVAGGAVLYERIAEDRRAAT